MVVRSPRLSGRAWGATQCRGPLGPKPAEWAGIKGKGEKEPACGGLEVGEVALPDEAGPIRRGHLSQPVFGDRMSVPALGGAGPEAARLPGPQTLFPPEPGHAIFAAALAAVLEIEPHAQTTVGAPALLAANSRSSRRPVLLLRFMVVMLFITAQPAKSRKL